MPRFGCSLVTSTIAGHNNLPHPIPSCIHAKHQRSRLEAAANCRLSVACGTILGFIECVTSQTGKHLDVGSFGSTHRPSSILLHPWSHLDFAVPRAITASTEGHMADPFNPSMPKSLGTNDVNELTQKKAQKRIAYQKLQLKTVENCSFLISNLGTLQR